jgi:outer membrane protein assembly factor BamB
MTMKQASSGQIREFLPLRNRRMRKDHVLFLVAFVLVLPLVATGQVGDGRNPAVVPVNLAERLVKEGISGGLVVHVGFSMPNLAIDLAEDRRFVLHALSRDAERVDDARTRLQEKGIVQRIVVECVTGPKLPHADNLARAIVVEDDSGIESNEVDRVLSPHGLLLRRQGDRWQGKTKETPSGMDDWPYVDHDAGRTRVSTDRMIGPPTNVRWLTRTRYRPGFCVVAGGRMFYTMRTDPSFTLVALCAFSGTVLWSQTYESNTAPPEVIATEKLVYAPGKAFAADTGELRLTYTGCPRVLTDGVLVVSSFAGGRPEFSAIRPDAGKTLWTYAARDGVGIGRKHIALASPHETVLRAVEIPTGQSSWTQDVERLARQVGVDDFDKQWMQGECTLTATTQYVAVCSRWKSQRCVLIFSATDGSFLRVVNFSPSDWWDGKGNRRPESVFALSGTNLWCWVNPSVDVQILNAGRTGWESLGTHQSLKAVGATLGLVGVNISNGKLVGAVKPEGERPVDMSQRCFSGYVWSEHYAFRGRMNTIDMSNGHIEPAIFAGGDCCFANVPAYGLQFVGPNWRRSGTGLKGLAALECRTSAGRTQVEDLRKEYLQKGPAYDGTIADGELKPRATGTWPLAKDSPDTVEWKKVLECQITTEKLEVKRGLLPQSTAWLIPPPFGGRRTYSEATSWTGYCNLSAPLLCDKLLLVCVPEERRLVAIDTDSGQVRWEFAAAARFFGAPNWCGEICLVGNWDGWIYAIRLTDGKLAWRNLAGPEDRRIMWEEKIVSAWPVTGELLAKGDRVYSIAGLHNLIADGGTTLACFDLRTGKTIWKRRVPSVASRRVGTAASSESQEGLFPMRALHSSLRPATSAVVYGPWFFATEDGSTSNRPTSDFVPTPNDFLDRVAVSVQEQNAVATITEDGILRCFRRVLADSPGKKDK